MHDARAIREEPERFISGWERRGVADASSLVESLITTDQMLRASQTTVQQLQSRRNDTSKLIGAAKAAKDEERAQRLMAEVADFKAGIEQELEAERQFGQQLKDELAKLPNLPADDVPEGADEAGNVEVKRWGDPASLPAARLNAPKDHATLGEALGLMDFERAARMSGSRFVALKGGLARLERALGQFMLDVQTTEHGYGEVSPPLLVRDEAVFGTGQLPKFGEDLFAAGSFAKSDLRGELAIDLVSEIAGNRYIAEVLLGARSLASLGADDPETRNEIPLKRARLESKMRALMRGGSLDDHLWLIPTAEVSLTNLVREEITPEETLPLRMTALTPCFRSEAGASGRDTRGMIRQHQFSKVELVSITTPSSPRPSTNA